MALLKCYRIAGKFGGGKVWRINRSANRLFIVSTNLDDFSLVNHGRFAKFAKFTKLSFHQTFPLYGSCDYGCDYGSCDYGSCSIYWHYSTNNKKLFVCSPSLLFFWIPMYISPTFIIESLHLVIYVFMYTIAHDDIGRKAKTLFTLGSEG